MKSFHATGPSKLLSALAVTAALAFGQQAAANQQVELIPEDTLFYLGTGKPVAVEDFFAMLPGGMNVEAVEEMVPQLENVEGSKEIFKKITAFIKNPTEFTQRWGLGEELEFSAYTVGLLPVFRVAGDAEQFETALNETMAENEKAEFDTFTHKDIKVRVKASKSSTNEAPAIKAPTAAEVQAAESKLATMKEESDIATQALDAANAKLNTAKKENDASGIASAATEMADAAAEISTVTEKYQAAQQDLAKLTKRASDAEKMQLAGGKSGAGMIMAATGKDLVFAFASNAYDPDLLDQLLGLEKPKKSLETSGKLKKIRKEWDYGDEMAMFMDFQLVADALTGGDTLAAQQLKEFSAADKSMESDLKPFSAEPCRTEIRQMAANWPMIVSGNRRFEVGDEVINYDSHFAIISEHEAVKSTLKLLRGAVPVSQSNSQPLLSFGLGLNVDTAPQLSSQLTDLVSGVNYQCEMLQGINKISGTDISALSMGAMMFSGMARGVKGISFNVYDGEVDLEGALPVKGIDTAIAIAAEDPATLVQTLRMIPQLGMLATMPLDGTPISLNEMLPVPVPEDAEFFAAVKDKSIVIYSGSEAEDFANRLSGSGDEGFIVSSMNTKKLINKFKEVIEQLPPEVQEENELSQMLGLMKTYPLGNLSYKIDFTDRGIELESISEVERAAK